MKKAIENYPVYTSHDWTLLIVATVLFIGFVAFCWWLLYPTKRDLEKIEDYNDEEMKAFHEEILLHHNN